MVRGCPTPVQGQIYEKLKGKTIMKHGIGRKLLSVVLAVMMLVSLLPTAAFADEISSYSAKNIVVNDVVDDSNTGNDTEPADEAPNAAVVNESEGEESTAITTNEELAAAINAADNGATITLGEGTFTTCGNTSPNKSLTFVGAGTGKTVWTIGDLTVNTKGEGNGDYSFDGCDTITFKNMTLTAVSEVSNNYRGFIRIKNTVVEGCTINGMTTYWGYETAQFENVTFNAPGEDYALWIYSTPSVSITNCNFNIAGKGIHVYNEGGYTEPVKVELNNCAITSTKDNKAFVNIKNSNLPCELTLSGDNKMTINGVEAAVEKFYQVQTTEVTETSGKPVTVQTKATDGTLTTIYAVKAEETSTAVAKIGDTSYDTLDAALAYLTSLKQEDLEFDASLYALTLSNDSVWTEAPVYWAAGEQHGYVATLTDALTAAYKANAGKITIVCRPGADVGTMTHGHVADNITIFGNKAYVSSGECDLEVDTYKFSRETGKQDNNGDYLKNNVTILAYQLDNLGVWGQRNTDNIVAVSLVDCDSVNGITAQRVYISGTSGKNAIVVTDCEFETAATAIYSNADGRVEVYNCTFKNSKVPVNINHKAAGKMIVDMQKCTFTKCGDAGEWKQFAAPVRFVNSGSGTMETGVRETTFTDTVGTNGDILLGDGRTGQKSNDVSLYVSDTDANIQAQKPGYYNGTGTDATKKAEKAVKSNETLDTSVEKLLPAENVIDLNTFIERVKAANYNYDGKGVIVKWSPVSGCYDTRAGHECTVENVKATGNTPKRVNSGLTQFQLFEGQSDNVTVKNVKFVYEPADFTVCENSGWKGSFTAADAPAGQLYFMTTGDVNFEGCTFDKVVLTSFNTTGTTTVKNCQFANVYNNYAIKDIRGANISVTGTTITNCGGGIMVSSTDKVEKVTIWKNTFTNVDVAGTAAADKVGTRALIQIASSGDYSGTSFNLTANTATDCGPVLRQLNQTVVDSGKIDTVKSDVASLVKSGTTGLGTTDSLLEQPVPAGYVEDEKGNVTISNEAGLFWFAKQVNEKGNTFAGKIVTLANDITLTKTWKPIGDFASNKAFKGTFDGQNHTVSGMQVRKYSTNGVGFFAKTFTATVKNLTVEGKITAYGCNYVGGIVGHGYATITNCTFRGTITNNGGYQVGGIAGSGGFTIKDCAVYGDISAESWVGGIAGNVQDGGAFTNCYVEGTISANSSAYGASAAGIAAIPLYKTQKISGCYSNTVVKCGDEEINAPIIGAYNSAGVTADTELYIYDNSWNKAKNPNDSYEVKDGATVIEGKDVSRDNNLVMLEDDLQYVTDLSKVRIMAGSAVTQEQVDALAVASIGTAKYISLAAAIAAANNGDTVTLLKDVTENVEIAKEKNLTLDLNGKTLNGGTGTAKAALTNYGTITIQDTSAAKTGTIKRDDTGVVGETSYYVIRNQGTMTIESGTVINNSGYKQASSIGSMNGSSLICNGDCDEGGTLTIKGGTFTQNNFIAIKNGALGVLHVTGGTITSNHSAIQNWFKADITGGEIKGQLWTDAWKEGESVGETKIGGDAKFTGEIVMDITGKVAPTLAINGGNLNVTNWRITSAAANAGAKPAVSGGKFTSAVPENYCADGFIPTKNADGTYGVKQGTYVAETNGVKYESLQAAIDAAARKATVKMLADTKENVTISTPYLTLDLNGFTLNGGTEKGKPALTVTARVTVKDSSKLQTGTIMREDTAETSGVSSHYVIDIQGGGWLTFEGGTVTNNSGNAAGKGASLVRVGNDSVAKFPGLNIKGGTFTQDNFIVIKVDRGDLFLNGGTLNSANSYAVENWLRATIKGGTVNGAVSSWTYSSGSNSTLEISGGTVNGNVESVSYDGAEGKLAKVKITGGTVNGTLSTKRYDNATAPSKDMATIEITGGTFSNDPTKYVVEDSSVTKNEDNTYGVAKAYLAKVGETSYYTMDEAFKAQTDSGEPIVMLRDYTTGSTFNSGTVARVVDLGGHTWTCTGTDANSAAFEINNPNATLTVKNGKIVSSQLVGLIPSAMGGTIKYDNSSLTFENVEMSTTATSGIETNGNNTNDTVTLKNSTLNVPNGFGIYFPSSGTLTIDNSTINAKTMGVQVCAGSLSINEGSKITVTGDPVEKTENDGAIQDGAAISIVNRGYKPFGEIAITGGTFTAKAGNNAIKAYNWDNTNKVETTFTANDKVAVSGGTFSSAVPAGLCATGYVPTAVDADGNYTVEKVMVAQIGNNKYGTLSEAIAAANAGDTVKLLRDINTPEISYMISKSLTIDLNGKTVTGDGYDAVFQINNADAKVLIKNGNIVAVENTGSAGKYAMAIWACKAECEVTLENLNASQKITHTDDPQMDMIYASGGTIIINSGNFKSGTPAWTLNCKDAAYKDGTANIIVKGGTFTGFDPANNKAEGENTNFVAAGYKSVDNGNGTYTVIVNEAVVAVIGDKEYETLAAATTDAKAGDTIVLVADAKGEQFVVIMSGVTLNLNGHSITGATMFYASGEVIDTSATKGVVSATSYSMNLENTYTSIYDKEKSGYSFFDLTIQSGVKNVEGDANAKAVQFRLKKDTNAALAERNRAFELLKKGVDSSRVEARVTVTWTDGDTTQHLIFVFTDDFMAQYCNPTQAKLFQVIFSGLDSIQANSIKAVASFVTYDGNNNVTHITHGKTETIK